MIPGAEPFEWGVGSHGILFVHGWTSSPRELRFLAQCFSPHDFRCKGILLKGHGTEYRDLNQYTWKDHLDQCISAFENLSAKCEDVSLVGLSYGSLLCLQTALRKKVKNLVFLAPFLQTTDRVWGLIPQSTLIPYLPHSIEVFKKKGGGPILDPEANRHHIAYKMMPVPSLKSVIDCLRNIRPKLNQIKQPVLILHSQKDQTAAFAGGQYLLRHLGSKDKTLRTLTRSNHIITLDYDRAFVESQVTEWVKKHLP